MVELKQTIYDQIDKNFSDIIHDRSHMQELTDNMRNQYVDIFDEIILDSLQNEGFDVNSMEYVEYIDYNVILSPIKSSDYFTEAFIESNDITNTMSQDELDIHLQVHEGYADTLIDNIEGFEIEVNIKSLASEFNNEYPTFEYFLESLVRVYSDDEMRKVIIEEQYGVQDKLRETAIDEGFSEEDIDKLDYEIGDIQFKVSMEDFADGMYDDILAGDISAVEYANEHFYEDFVTNVDFEINILTDPEDLDE